jgi:hypothetical protein
MTERRIEIRYPLPLDVAAALTNAIGTMWPDAKIDTRTSDALAIILPAKTPKRVSKKALRAEADIPDPDSEVTRFDGQTLTATTPREISACLADLGYQLLTATEGAENYVEMEASDLDGKRIVFSVAWSKAQTPHHLRQAAEHRASELFDECQRLKRRVTELEKVKGA